VVLTLKTSRACSTRKPRAAPLQALAAGVRAPWRTLRGRREPRPFPTWAPAPGAFAIVAEESRGLSQKLNDALRDYADALNANLTLEDMRAGTCSGCAPRIESALGMGAGGRTTVCGCGPTALR
jgi:hypothetical protein